MNANFLIHNELRKLESSAHVALSQIRTARSIRDVVHSMSIPVPAVVRGLRRSVPSYPRISQEAHRRVESLVRGQIQALANTTSEEEFLKLRGQYEREWQLLSGRFPKIASYVRVEAPRLLAKLRNSPPVACANNNQ